MIAALEDDVNRTFLLKLHRLIKATASKFYFKYSFDTGIVLNTFNNEINPLLTIY